MVFIRVLDLDHDATRRPIDDSTSRARALPSGPSRAPDIPGPDNRPSDAAAAEILQ